jgi:FtsP/CotA-like multicopper oxidase with cupredoxin domain
MTTALRTCIALATAACGSEQPARPLAPPVLTDTNPEASIVEVELVASPATQEYLPDKLADVMAFRDGAIAGSVGTVPGPMLEAKLGDKVIVHFRNELATETTIHWHGLRVPNAADGTPFAQVPVPPGGAFDYEFTLVDAGLYWYHPHMRGDEQVEAGLYAPIVVHDTVAIDVAADRVFVLDDVKLESTGKLSDAIGNLDLMLGRMGNVVLINGQKHPAMQAAAGSRERWRFVNSANGRYFNLELPGHALRVIGWDGGLVETPYETTTLLIAPGERYDVLVELTGSEGDALELRTLHYDRGHNIPDPGPIEVLAIELGPSVAPAAALPASFGVIDAIPFDDNTPRRRFVLEEDDTDPSKPVFTINSEAFPNITPVRGPTGLVEIWEIDNQAEMDHPFHLHGMSLQQVGAQTGWKDTINVKQKSVVQLAVRYGDPGRWMYHCHILEHAERGMMGELEVGP